VSLLIVGGLFIVAVLAIVVMIFVLRGEPDTNATASAPSPKPLAAEQNEPATQKTSASKPSVAAQTAPVPTEDFTTGPEDPQTDEWNPVANGQFHELANELRTLHQQAQEFEYRLSVLRDMIERIEYARHNHMTIEEHAQHRSDVSSVN